MSETKDAMGRTFSSICGWIGVKQAVPIGSEIVLHKEERTGRVLGFSFCGAYAGRRAIVLGHSKPTWRSDNPDLRVRLVEPVNEMEAFGNINVIKDCQAEVVKIGDGTVTPGESFQLCKIEVLRNRYATMDHSYEDFSNPPTYLAHLYLRTDAKHHEAVLGMIRADGKINPQRLENYFRKQGLKIDSWAFYPDGFPELWEFHYQVDWNEVATEFLTLAKEKAA